MKKSYQAYLIRLQRSAGSAQWRASLQNAQTGEVVRFGSEREMFRYLWQALTSAPLAGEPPSGASGKEAKL